MKIRWISLALAAALVTSGLAQAQVNLSALDKNMAGPPTKVLVLGTVHLSALPKSFKPESLKPLLARLAAFKPDIIAIEKISGRSCYLMAHYPTLFIPSEIARYCTRSVKAWAATGLDIPSAIAQVHKTLKHWPAQPTPAQRRHLAALFLAAHDGASALTQWLQLPQAERHPGDGLNKVLVKELNTLVTTQNEDYLIGARLAARLGLQRVFPIDDHTGDNVFVSDVHAYAAAIKKAWHSAHAQRQPIENHTQKLEKAGNMLALYQYINRPGVMQNDQETDFGANLREPSPQHYGRMYVTGWETRNLRMVANVLATFREKPGARVLVIVGSEHKPWFDSLLSHLPGVQVVNAEKVLGAAPR